MSAREMTPERLAEVREMCSPLARRHASWDAIHDAVAHIDAITADRDEARQEVAALRAQRDEIREVHRVETAALAARLEAAERERETNAERCLEALDDIAKLLVERNAAQARADAAEAKLAAIDAPFLGGALHHIEMLHADQRESRDREEALVLKLDAAEAKLAALVEAAKYRPNPACPSCLGHGQVDLATNGIGNFVKARCASCRLSWEEGLRRAAQGEP